MLSTLGSALRNRALNLNRDITPFFKKLSSGDVQAIEQLYYLI